MLIIRRRVTVTTSGVIDIPFSCPACRLTTTAHASVQGRGWATAGYFGSADETARAHALLDMEKRAHALVDGCLCPRCGAPTEKAVRILAEYDAANPGGVSRRRRTVLFVCLGITALVALSCVLAMIAAPTPGKTAGDMVGVAVCAALVLASIGAGLSALVYAVMRPGARPVLATSNPSQLWFDPPREG